MVFKSKFGLIFQTLCDTSARSAFQRLLSVSRGLENENARGLKIGKQAVMIEQL